MAGPTRIPEPGKPRRASRKWLATRSACRATSMLGELLMAAAAASPRNLPLCRLRRLVRFPWLPWSWFWFWKGNKALCLALATDRHKKSLFRIHALLDANDDALEFDNGGNWFLLVIRGRPFCLCFWIAAFAKMIGFIS
jgi:hypothetical protein